MTAGRVLIAGGGIGGLTAALCLARAGFDAVVFEQAPEFGEIGAGIQLSPNGSRVLHRLGLGPALEKCACLPRGTEFRAWKTGRLIASSTLGESARERYGAPYYHVHRGDLLGVLVDAARRHWAIELRESARVDDFSRVPGGVRVRVNDRSEDGDALIGADGIHSTVRAGLFGAAAPAFTGNLAWRALVPAERLPRGMPNPVATVWWGPGRHFVCYYLRGGALLNCVCVVEKEGWEVESWTERGEHAELRGDFAGWHEQVRILIDNMDRDTLYKWALHDRPPMARWGEGAVTLLGDACHPTLPFMAQGAAMAIEDAAVLAGCLSAGDETAAGLKRYEDLRRERTALVQTGSRRNAGLFHARGLKAWVRNRVAQRAAGRMADSLFRYDALAAAEQPATGGSPSSGR